MKMSESEFNKFTQIIEKALQAKLVCGLIEDYPHKLTEEEIDALASMLNGLTGDVYVYMREVAYQLENSK